MSLKILLSDGSGVTSRQVATILSRAGHRVHMLCPPGLSLGRFTRHVSRVHTVPPFGADPFAWLDAALRICTKEGFDVLLPTQEQVAVLSASADKVRALGIRICVPQPSSLRKVMDKISAYQTLQAAQLRQPDSTAANSGQALRRPATLGRYLPAYVKTPIGTAGRGVRHADSVDMLQAVAAQFVTEGAFREYDHLLIQSAVQGGQLLMIAAVFSGGELLAWHACLRVREGRSGGASAKTSLPLPVVKADLIKLGRHLDWDGALSLDAILLDSQPWYIDVNPRIVEPMNALLSGVDLVDVLVKLSTTDQTGRPRRETLSKVDDLRLRNEGIRSHQLLLALGSAAEQGRGSVLREVLDAMFRRAYYAASTEELTPVEDDWLAGLFMFLLVLVLLVGGPKVARQLDKGAVSKYALSYLGWKAILEAEESDQDLETTH